MSGIEGGCFCGAIRYRILEQAGATVCDCENCRKVVGAQAVAWVNTQPDHVDVVQGEAAHYPAENGTVWSFCGKCGSTLFWERPDRPRAFAVTTGTLDDPASFAPEGAAGKSTGSRG